MTKDDQSSDERKNRSDGVLEYWSDGVMEANK